MLSWSEILTWSRVFIHRWIFPISVHLKLDLFCPGFDNCANPKWGSKLFKVLKHWTHWSHIDQKRWNRHWWWTHFWVSQRNWIILNVWLFSQINLGLSHDPNEIGSIVFNQRHRVGIHLKCQASKGVQSSNAYLIVKICFHREEKPEVVNEQRVKVYVEKQDWFLL